MDTESAWRERYSKGDLTFQDIVDHLREECFTEDIFEGNDNTKAFRWKAVLYEYWPRGNLNFAALWKGDTVPQLPGKTWREVTAAQLAHISRSATGTAPYHMPLSHFMETMYRDGDVSAADIQQRLLYERRNQAAELRKQIMGLSHELHQTFCGSDCDKIVDILITQSHGRLQQYIDDMNLMIQATLDIVLQQGIRPLTHRLDPLSLENTPAAVIARAMLREFPELETIRVSSPLA